MPERTLGSVHPRDCIAATDKEIEKTFGSPWKPVRATNTPANGVGVAAVSDMRQDPIEIHSSVLFCDIKESTHLVTGMDPNVSGRIIQAMLYAMVRPILFYGGEIRSFDGDRVMALFTESAPHGRGSRRDRAHDAAKAAFLIKSIMVASVRPRVQRFIAETKIEEFTPGWVTGIATGNIDVLPVGTKKFNDMVFLGAATNRAARLSEVRGKPADVRETFIDKPTYELFPKKNGRMHSRRDGRKVWGSMDPGATGVDFDLYGSNCSLEDMLGFHEDDPAKAYLHREIPIIGDLGGVSSRWGPRFQSEEEEFISRLAGEEGFPD